MRDFLKVNISTAERQKAEMEAMIRETRPYELNLRKMAILGGVLHLDLIQQPPQPRELNKNLSLTVCELMPCTGFVSS
jgi:hypothetical protein